MSSIKVMPVSYTTIYPFMWEDLKLDGYAKEIYAVIFGFCIRSDNPVQVPYRIIQKITGAGHATVANCIRKLESENLMKVHHSHGRCTEYSLCISDVVLQKYYEQSGCERPGVIPEPDNPVSQHHSKDQTSAACESSKAKKSSKYPQTDPIRVPDASSFKVSTVLKTLSTGSVI